jgi:hypothetical protein
LTPDRSEPTPGKGAAEPWPPELPPRNCNTVVDDDIDIQIMPQSIGRIAYRVNAGENDVVVMLLTFGAGFDPSTRGRDRNPALFGTGEWN